MSGVSWLYIEDRKADIMKIHDARNPGVYEFTTKFAEVSRIHGPKRMQRVYHAIINRYPKRELMVKQAYWLLYLLRPDLFVISESEAA